jgi:hypothetical protein
VKKTGARARARPVAVTLVAGLAIAAGLYNLAEGGVELAGGGSSRVAAGAVDLLLGVLALAIARGALRLAPWAWAAFMTWAVIGLTHQLLRHFFYDDESYALLAVDTFVVFALTPLDIQVAFGVRRRPSLDTASGAHGDGG